MLNIVDHRQVGYPAAALRDVLFTFSHRLIICILFFQGGTLNKTTKRSGQEQRDSDREPLNPGGDEQNEDDGGEVVRSRSANS